MSPDLDTHGFSVSKILHFCSFTCNYFTKVTSQDGSPVSASVLEFSRKGSWEHAHQSSDLNQLGNWMHCFLFVSWNFGSLNTHMPLQSGVKLLTGHSMTPIPAPESFPVMECPVLPVAGRERGDGRDGGRAHSFWSRYYQSGSWTR